MTQHQLFPLTLLAAGLVSAAMFEEGPLVGVAQAQRFNGGDEGGDRGDRRFGGPGGRGFGGEGGRRRGFFRRDSNGDGENGGERPRRPDQGSNGRNGDGGSSMSTAEFARQLVKERDKNGNMMLEGDELRELRGPAALADANNDKVITVEEIVARLSDRGGSGSGSSRGSTGGTSSSPNGAAAAAAGKTKREYFGLAGAGGVGDSNSANKRRTYRFTPASERLPAGLPSWFKSSDRNQDGQVAMSEYSRSWSKSKVNDFRRYDLNDDGIVTAKEAVK
jgi:hypothetical protein